MNSKFATQYIIFTLRYLFIFLFVYAAISKLVVYSDFQVQVAQSPLLTAHAFYIPAFIITIELICAILLSIPRAVIYGLHCALALMTTFTMYIWLILNYSPYIPCSCGGILEEMTWEQHLYFNIAITILAMIGIVAVAKLRNSLMKKQIVLVVLNIAISALLLIVLFITSENSVHKNNSFIRRFPPHAAKRLADIDLKHQSYYFAGLDNGQIYLGNYTAPSLVTVIDTSLKSRKSINLIVTDTLHKFKKVQLRVIPPNFYLLDGTIPIIFSGYLATQKAQPHLNKIPSFTKAVIIDSSAIIARTLNSKREHALSKVHIGIEINSVTNNNLLEKQKDGFFDTDGSLHYDHATNKVVYVYYYRNQFIVTDSNLNLQQRHRTIDTNTIAKIKTEYVGSQKIRQFSAPPLMINRTSTVLKNVLFINSTLPSRIESKEMWKQANVIDVYNITDGAYLLSFYIYKIRGEQIDEIIANDTHVFALIGSKIVSYRLTAEITKNYSK